ncbi:hypothetical protein ACI2OX_20390 [Bacillus sp. N9]
MAGFTPALAAAVWTGYDQGKDLTLTEDKVVAKNVWIRFMEQAIEGQMEQLHEFKPPAGVEALPIDPETGKIATEFCPVFRLTYFKKGRSQLKFVLITFRLHQTRSNTQ